MRILVLTNLYPPHYLGGYEVICYTVVNELRARGHDVSILTSNHGVVGPETYDAFERGVERSLRIHGFYGHPWLGIHRLYQLEAHNNRILRNALARHAPELVYVWNMGGLSKSMLFTLREENVPTVFYLSDHWIARGLRTDVWLRWWNSNAATLRQRLLRQMWTRLGLRQRCHAIAPTSAVEQLKFRRIYFCSRALRELTVRAGFAVDHGAIIYCPVDMRLYWGEPHWGAEPLRRLLYVGRLSADKGVMTALRALAFLRGKFSGWLDIYGQGETAYIAQLKRFADENQLPVTFASATMAEMPVVYRSHDALLFTSEWDEPFALTPLEAMGCGLPVIGTATGGSAEFFRDGENALTYPAGNAHELAKRIQQLAENRALRQRIAVTGHCEARQRFDVPVIVSQIEEYLRETPATWSEPLMNGCISEPQCV